MIQAQDKRRDTFGNKRQMPVQSGLAAALGIVLRRDLILAIRRMSDVLTTLFFFVIVVSLFPLGVGPEIAVLREIAPGVIWVAALLASMLALEQLLSDDYRDGSLEQLLLVPQPLSLLLLSKVLAHWLISGAPLVLIAPLLGLQLGLSWDAIQVLMLTLLLGTPAMSLIGAVGAALTLGLRGRGVLLALLVLPLYIPILIFGAGAVEASISGLGATAHVSLLAAILVLSLCFAPLATAMAVKISIE